MTDDRRTTESNAQIDLLASPQVKRIHLTDSIIDCFRLFYLCQDTMLTYITEESFFTCLTWLCHAVCGMIISSLVGENFFYDEFETSITYSNCARFPVFSGAWSYQFYVIVQVAIGILSLIAQKSIFLRKKQLAKQSASEWVALYSANGVKFEKKKPPSSRILWKDNRNVVSPLGSFLSLIVGITFHPIVAYLYNGSSIIGEFLLFSRHSVTFFSLNFIETMCSPTLRNTLLDVILWWRH